MNLPPNVRIKSGLLSILPFSKYTGQAIYPNIFLTKTVYDNLKSNNPNPRFIAVLKHEQTHIQRQKEMGWIKWGLKYLMSPSFRYKEELKAIKSSMKYLKREGVNFNTNKGAKYLSSWLYLWCVSYEKAKNELDNAWNEA